METTTRKTHNQTLKSSVAVSGAGRFASVIGAPGVFRKIQVKSRSFHELTRPLVPVCFIMYLHLYLISLLCVCLSPHTIAHPSPVLQHTRLVASACRRRRRRRRLGEADASTEGAKNRLSLVNFLPLGKFFTH